MENDGFLYPTVDSEKCIECGRCTDVCISGREDTLIKPMNEMFAGMTKNEEDFYKSAAGGMFKVIVSSLVQFYGSQYENFYCCGCVLDNDFKAVHKIVKICDDASVDVFSKSKYIESDFHGVLPEIRQLCNDQRNYVIVSGTPCQIAECRQFLHTEYDNVFYIDLVCYGAPSQRIFDEYRKHLEKENGSKLISYEFRTKDILDNGTRYARSAKITFSNGTVKRVSRLEDDYLQLYYEHKYIPRSSCTKCPFRNFMRVGDATIGDAWGIQNIHPQVNPLHGCSMVMLSEKALCVNGLIRKKIHSFSFSLVSARAYSNNLGR